MTTTTPETLAQVLTKADLNKLQAALAQIDLGTMLKPAEYDTGTISAVDAITLPNNGALLVQSARVVTGGATFLGVYVASDSGVTPLTTGSGAAVGIAKLSAEGKTITFPTGTNATRVIVRYIPAPATLLTNDFKRS